MKYKSVFGDEEHFRTMPIDYLHGVTHDCLLGHGFKRADSPDTAPDRLWSRTFNASDDAVSHPHTNLPEMGWKFHRRVMSGGHMVGIYEHPNGSELQHRQFGAGSLMVEGMKFLTPDRAGRYR